MKKKKYNLASGQKIKRVSNPPKCNALVDTTSVFNSCQNEATKLYTYLHAFEETY